MKLEIVSINDKGVLEKEVVWLKVIEDCDLQFSMLCDTTYTDEKTISNELRHIFWFPEKRVSRNDYVALYTKVGKNNSIRNNHQSNTHYFYWNLGKTVWNKERECAVLFNIDEWRTKAS